MSQTRVERSRGVRGTAAVVCVVGALLAGGCQRGGDAAAGAPGGDATRITIAGSSALVPLATEAANRFMRTHPGVTITVSAGGSRQGLAQVAAEAVTIGASDVAAAGAPAAALQDHQVAVVGFAAMANRGAFDERVASLTQAQLRGIFTGEVRNWSQVGGGDQPITVINRARNSGTRAVFGQVVLGGDRFVEGTAEQDNSGQLQSMLAQQVGAISYLALSYRSDRLKVFAYEGVEPTAENIANGTYPIWSHEHMYTRGPATGAVRAFLDFVASPAFQDDVLPRMGFVPVARVRAAQPPAVP